MQKGLKIVKNFNEDSRVIRWGVLGAARIAIDRVIPAILEAKNAEIISIASRDVNKALEVANRFLE